MAEREGEKRVKPAREIRLGPYEFYRETEENIPDELWGSKYSVIVKEMSAEKFDSARRGDLVINEQDSIRENITRELRRQFEWPER